MFVSPADSNTSF
ncbi:hypothetical protein E2C01_096584 [Portunus trituberculatus]|uniref:Uncharacterized protein n=1 Tax=Portunus trituberculatus TaxID=210409 RepID=A0A5B7JSX8_PORTR|nr:hypothetical protein [Portunus trituberculatus]